MTQYITRRILISIPLLFGVSIITFIIINLAPGDPLSHLIDPEQGAISVRDVEEIRRRFGLDQPGPVRYLIWLREAVTGNLGFSFQFERPVSEMILERLPVTLSLMLVALSAAMSLGVIFGVISALRQYSILDYSLSVFSFFLISIPQFFFALTGIIVFAVWLGWLPTYGMWTPGGDTSFNWDLIYHAILPIMALMLQDIAVYMRYTRASMLDTLSADFVQTARAKGLSETVVLWKHVLRNALVPLVTIIGLSLPALIGGALIIETIFSWPGVGALAYRALLQRDYPLQMGVLLMGATAVLAANLLTDVAYAWVDPRVRHA